MNCERCGHEFQWFEIGRKTATGVVHNDPREGICPPKPCLRCRRPRMSLVHATFAGVMIEARVSGVSIETREHPYEPDTGN